MEKQSNKDFFTCLGSVLASIITGVFLLISVGKIPFPSLAEVMQLTPGIPTTVAPAYIVTSTSSVSPSVRGNIEAITVDHNVYDNNNKGMRIHINFTVIGRKDITCKVIAYFYYVSGEALKDFNDSYGTTDGKVGVGEDFTPGYDDTRYEDFILFMPYDELHMGEGEFSLALVVKLYDSVTDIFLAQSDAIGFTFTK